LICITHSIFRRVVDEQDTIKRIISKQNIIPGLKGTLEAFESLITIINKFIPSLADVTMLDILGTS
jgi:hypothetical protein